MEKEQSNSNFIYNRIDKDLEQNKYGGKVYTRFPPEPNGYLHIGHAKSICLNFGTAQKYQGLCNLRFDDTNPAKEDVEYVESIKEDVQWLGFKWDKLLFASDYFEKMYQCAVRLIEKGKAYVCDLTPEEIRQYRGTLTEKGKESPCRNRSVEENLNLFKEMKEGKYEDGTKVLRAKIDMNSPNLNMRDPIIYRISKSIHHNTQDQWCIYPMYDFAHPLEDAFEGITHSLCTLEFEDHRPLYEWVLETLDFKNPPQQIEFARLNLTNTVMSKRHLKALVDEGKVNGWDDPRMPTIAGLRARGYTPESIRTFCDKIGVAKTNSIVEMGFLEFCIREDLKLKVQTKMVVEDPIKLTITNYPKGEYEWVEIENSKEQPELGTREVTFSDTLYISREDFMEEPPKKYFRLFPGNEVRLKGAYFVKCHDFIKDTQGKVTEILCTYDPKTKSGSGFNERKVKGTIHWVDEKTAVPVTIREYGYLMDENEEGTLVFNENSLVEKQGYGEPSIKADQDKWYQFFRYGYYCRVETENKETCIFNKTVGLKSSWRPER